MSDKSFANLNLEATWLENLDQLGYLQMTPIQADALPHMLEGKDVIGQASTGTGKTAAFGLALLSKIEPAGQVPGALVLCPTRELATQVAEEIRRLARPLPNTNVVVLTGGTSVSRQRTSLAHGADVVVGTPGRVLDHLRRKSLDVSGVRTLVLDEADRMLDMGFLEDVQTVAELVAPERQTHLFSATMSEDVERLSQTFQRDPVWVEADSETPDITQILYDLQGIDRFDALERVLSYHSLESAVIFCNERDTVDACRAVLKHAGYSVEGLHGGMEQRDREAVLRLFSNQSVRFLVATNVAARGIDIQELGAVINFEMPRDITEFVHRVGRTGRAGESGLAISLLGRSDARKVEALPELLGGIEPRMASKLPSASTSPEPAKMRTLMLFAGKRDKLRPGDVVGAFTGDFGLDVDALGKITIEDRASYVAVASEVAEAALVKLRKGQIKGKNIKGQLV